MDVVIGGSNQKLKECPCCGSDEIWIGQSSFLSYAVQCESCGLKMEKQITNKRMKDASRRAFFLAAAKVIEYWNKRAQ